MSGEYTQIYVQFIFAVGDKNCLIPAPKAQELYRQIHSFLRDTGHTPIVVNGSHDHIHVFASVNPRMSVSHIADSIRTDSAVYMNSEVYTDGRFHWQSGYGAFTYSKTRTNDVYLYIQSQDRYHSKRTFREEFIEFLRLFGVDYDPALLPLGLEEFTLTAESSGN